MRLASTAKLEKDVYEKYPEVLKHKLKEGILNELMKHDVFIEPPIENKDGYVSMEMHFFALSFSDVRKLQDLAMIYPDIAHQLRSIIVDVSKEDIKKSPLSNQ